MVHLFINRVHLFNIDPVAKQENPKADEDSFLPKMMMAYRRYGENALLGWDMGRAAYIIQWCYFVGYVSMEEVLEIGVEAGKKAQQYFQNWEEMMESYLLGGNIGKEKMLPILIL